MKPSGMTQFRRGLFPGSTREFLRQTRHLAWSPLTPAQRPLFILKSDTGTRQPSLARTVGRRMRGTWEYWFVEKPVSRQAQVVWTDRGPAARSPGGLIGPGLLKGCILHTRVRLDVECISFCGPALSASACICGHMSSSRRQS